MKRFTEIWRVTAWLIALLLCISGVARAQGLFCDLNGDGLIDSTDLNIAASQDGNPGVPQVSCTNADLDGNGVCDATDYNRLYVAVVSEGTAGCLVGPGGSTTIASLSPTMATAGGPSFNLMVSGSNYYQGGSTPAVVYWNGSPLSTAVTGFNASAATLSASVPASLITSTGTVTITVISGDVSSNSSTFTIVPPPPVPTLTSISPNSGPVGSNVPITLTGTNFDSTARITVNHPDVIVTNIVVVSATQITATLQIPATSLVASMDVGVVTSTGSSATVPFIVTKPSPPTLTSIAPGSGAQGATVAVTLTGTNFISGATVAVSNSGVTVSQVSVVNATQITASFVIAASVPAGAVTVTVTTSAGATGPVDFKITAPAPTLTSVSPATGAQNTSVAVTLAGSNFIPGATLAVSNSGITVSNVNVVSGTQITATLGIAFNAAAGAATIAVTTAGGTSGTVAFTVTTPATLPTVSIGGNTTIAPLQTGSFSIGLPTPAPASSSGSLSLQFTSDAVNPVSSDPEITFDSGTTPVTSVSFSFAPGQMQATLSPSGVVVHAGTVAGTVSVLIDSYQGSTPSNPILGAITISRTAPQITSIKLANKTATGFDVCVAGYSSPRDITSVSYQFVASGQGTLQTMQLAGGSDLIGKFTSWFQSATSVPTGSQFLLDQTFTVSGSDTAIGSITVTLQNGSGSTTSASVPYSGFAATCN